MAELVKVIKRDVISIGIIFGVSAVIYLLIAFIPSNAAIFLNSLVSPVICMPLTSVYLFKSKKFEAKALDFLKPQKISMKSLGYILFCVLIMMGSSFLIGLISKAFNINSGNNEIIGTLPVWFVIALTCVIAPISEELFFRLSLSSISSEHKSIFEDFAAATIFSLFHFSIIHFPFYFVLSLLCIHGTRKYENIWVAIMIHSILNLIMVSLLI